MGIFSCPCCVCALVVACACGSLVSLLKLSQDGRNWQVVRRWERCWGICFSENIGSPAMATFDNSYRKCYNKRSDNNKNVISHQTGKFALQAAFAFRGIKSRRTPENAVQRIYIKYGNTKWLKLCAVQGQREKSYLYIQKRHFVKSLSCGYKIVIILPLAFPPWRW